MRKDSPQVVADRMDFIRHGLVAVLAVELVAKIGDYRSVSRTGGDPRCLIAVCASQRSPAHPQQHDPTLQIRVAGRYERDYDR